VPSQVCRSTPLAQPQNAAQSARLAQAPRHLMTLVLHYKEQRFSGACICQRRLAGDAQFNPRAAQASALATLPDQPYRWLRINCSITHSQ
jgi:hypothetical protein